MPELPLSRLPRPSANFLSIGTGSSTYHKLYFYSGSGTAILDAGSISFDRVEFRSNGNISGNVTYGDLVLTKGKPTILHKPVRTFLSIPF
jgi:hypothetical protein